MSKPDKMTPCDGPELISYLGVDLTNPLNFGTFKAMEDAYAQWCDGHARTPDGTWDLEAIRFTMESRVRGAKAWDRDAKKFEEWRQQFPNSLAEALTEAIYWQQYAAAANDANSPGGVDPDSDKRANERLESGIARLRSVADQRNSCPLWYVMMISLMTDLDRPVAEVRAVYQDGITAFPDYPSIYIEMARFYGPIRGNSEHAFERFAQEVAASNQSSLGAGMYARLYASRDPQDPVAILPGRPVSWSRLKASLEAWQARYPHSIFVENLTAAYACRAEDAKTYKAMRPKLTGVLLDEAWIKGYTPDTCDVHFGGDPDAR